MSKFLEIFVFIYCCVPFLTTKTYENGKYNNLSDQELLVSNFSHALEVKLKSIQITEMNSKIITEMFELMEYQSVEVNEIDIIKQISKRMSSKLDPAIQIIEEMCNFLNNDNHNHTNFLSLLNPCPDSSTIFKMDHYYNEIFRNIPEASKFDILNDKNLVFHKFLNEKIRSSK
jgi:hypothetical protein